MVGGGGNVGDASSTGVFQGQCEGVGQFHRSTLCTVPPFPTALSWQINFEGGTMPLGKRWLGIMLIGMGLMLFGVSRQHWQEWSGFATLAAGIVLVLLERITGGPAR